MALTFDRNTGRWTETISGHQYWEQKGSRDGSTMGVRGAVDLRQIWVRVNVDVENGYTLSDYDPRLLVQAEFIPPGTIPRWNPYLRATHYSLIRTEPPITYVVGVVYEQGEPAPTAEPETRRWMWSRQGTTITQRIVEEPLDAVLNPPYSPGAEMPGGSIRRVGEPYRYGTTSPVKMLATTSFAPVSTPGTPRYFADGVERDEAGNVTGSKIIELRPTPTYDLFDYDAEIPAVMLTGARIFPNCPSEVDTILVDHIKRVNRWEFRGADPGHVLLADYAINEVAMQVGDGSTQTEEGIAHRIAIGFLWSSERWTPLEKVPTVPDPVTGAASWVMTEDENGVQRKYVEEFRVKGARDFNGLLRTIEQRGWSG